MEYPFQPKTDLVKEHNYGVLCDRSGVGGALSKTSSIQWGSR